MVIKEIEEFSQVRVKARAYLCYLLSRHLVGAYGDKSVEELILRLNTLHKIVPKAQKIYILDRGGKIVASTLEGDMKEIKAGALLDRSNRAYFYRTIEEHRCVLTDPYPSYSTNQMVVTAAFPVYNKQGELIYILAIDLALKDILQMVHPSSIDSTFGTLSKWVYSAFSLALAGVALLLFVKGISSFLHLGLAFESIDINEMFKSTILLTLSLAIVDLTKAIFEEEVLGRQRREHNSEDTHQTMVRFLGSIIIALSIEALMLVFKFALTNPVMIVYAVILIGGVTLLIFGLSGYLKAIRLPEFRNKKK